METGVFRTSVVKPASFPENFFRPGHRRPRGWETSTMIQKSWEPIHSAPKTEPGVRLTIKAGTKSSGYVDGAWWPGSLDLVAEVPGLIDQLATPWGAVDRVSYDLAAWLPAVRSVPARGRRVRLDWFNGRLPTDAVHVVRAGRRPLILLVIPPSTNPREAAETLRRAASTGNQETVDQLLDRGPRLSGPEYDRTSVNAAARVGNGSRTADEATDRGRWKTDGGHDRGLGD